VQEHGATAGLLGGELLRILLEGLPTAFDIVREAGVKNVPMSIFLSLHGFEDLPIADITDGWRGAFGEQEARNLFASESLVLGPEVVVDLDAALAREVGQLGSVRQPGVRLIAQPLVDAIWRDAGFSRGHDVIGGWDSHR
jgi:hypothetical protein